MNQIEKSIQLINEDIEELQKRKEFLESLDTTKVLNEDEWHELCQSSLRSDNILSVFVHNIFPDAEDISITANYVKFLLYGIRCYLPTSLIRGIEIDTSWFIKTKKPIYMDDQSTCIPIKLKKLNAYLEATNWNDKAKAILGSYDRKIIRFFLWHFKYKYNDYIREHKEYQKKYDQQFERLSTQYNKVIIEQKEIIDTIRNKVIPELSKFTNNIKPYTDSVTTLQKSKLDTILNYYDNIDIEE